MTTCCADLLRAVEAQDLARVRQLLRAGAAAAGLDASGESALHKAAEDGRTEIFEELLGAAGDPNALDGKGRSVLYRTIINLNEARIKLALAAGADPSATRSDGGKPLWDVFILLIEDQDIMTDEELELLRRLPALLIKAGADPTMWLRLATSQAFDLEAAIKAVPRDKLGAAGEGATGQGLKLEGRGVCGGGLAVLSRDWEIAAKQSACCRCRGGTAFFPRVHVFCGSSRASPVANVRYSPT